MLGLATATQAQHDEGRQEVRKSSQTAVRELLRETPDGLTVTELSEKTGVHVNSIQRCIKNMPDAYIDRWSTTSRKKYYSAIWCVVVPPANCPKPEPRKPK